MKLIINYDLINEIRTANTGINVKRMGMKMGIYLGAISALNFTAFTLNHEINVVSLANGLFYAVAIFGGSELSTKNFNKQIAERRLESLASSLTKINIYTNTESIRNAHLYKTQYKIVHEDKMFLQQNKFLMLPTTGTFNADEVSLQQEHIIGSNEYVLSIGEPKKAQSKVFSKSLASQI